MYSNPSRVNETKLHTTPLGRYCADPNLTIFDNRYFLYCTDDGIDDWGTTSFSVYSSSELAQWDRHPILDLHDVPWWQGKGGAWAPSIVRNAENKYVFYFVADSQIGVAVADTPYGPFTPTDMPLISHNQFAGYNIDPSVFIAPNGSPYLLWGNGKAFAAPLNPDCLSFDDKRIVSATPGNFREAIWLHERQGTYYASWSENDTRDPEYCIHYAMAPSPTGPWSEPETLVEQDPEHGLYATGHHSIVNIPGTDEWIIAYHRFAYNPSGRWEGGNGSHRETVFAPLSYREDDSIRQVNPQVGSYVRSLDI